MMKIWKKRFFILLEFLWNLTRQEEEISATNEN